MEQINRFIKGIATDPDYSMRDNTGWDFPSMGVRIVNKEGQGYIITNLDGNTDTSDPVSYPNGEALRLNTDFKILGACEYNGIAYIFSFNESTLYCEIGCFPSPMTLDYDGTGIMPATTFERTYRALNNYAPGQVIPYSSTTPRQDMSNILFDWDSQHQIEVFAREDYDNSINLYFVDYKNPDRVINSGFNQSGVLNHRLYNDNDFNTNLNQVLAIGNSLQVELKEIVSPGGFKYGNIVFYFRYMNTSTDVTPFVEQSNACQIFEGDMSNMGLVQGGAWDDDSDKMVIFYANNVDTTYAYIEVAYTRYFSDISGVILSESFLIDNKWSTVGMTEIPITGHDTVIPIDPAELIVNKSLEVTSKTHTQLGNMCFKANMKGLDVNHDALEYLSSLIKLSWDTSLKINGQGYYGFETTAIDHNTVPNISNRLGQYKDYFKTYDKVGYFRTEAYPFSVVYELIDGFITDAYPVMGFDDLNISVPYSGTSNTIGVYRFPYQYVAGAEALNSNSELQIMGIKFDLTDFNNYLLNTSNTYYSWVRRYVKSIRLMRGNRFVNLKYQGLLMNVCKPYTEEQTEENITTAHSYLNKYYAPEQFLPAIPQKNNNHRIGQVPAKYNGGSGYMDAWWERICTGGNYENNPDNENWTSNTMIPLYKGYASMMYHHATNDELATYCSRWPMVKGKYAFYSPDHMYLLPNDFTNANDLIQIASISFTEYLDTTIGNVTDVVPHIMFSDVNSLTLINPSGAPEILNFNNITVGKLVTAPVTTPEFEPTSNSYLVNQTDDYFKSGTGGSNTIYWQKKVAGINGVQFWSNRSMYVMPYQFIYDPSSSPTNFMNLPNSICNIYEHKPLTTDALTTIAPGLTSTNYSSHPFYQISDKIILWDEDTNSLLPDNSYVCYKGDCYLQRTYFKQMSWNCSDVTANGTIVSCDYDGTGVTWDYPNDGYDQARNSHGLIIGIVTENAINTAMRYSSSVSDYYPHNSAWNVCIRPTTDNYHESKNYNAGHHQQLGQKEMMGFNSTLPPADNKRPTRIRHSAYHTPYSYTDGYRLFDVNSYKDYDLQYGQINSLQVLSDTLISIQEGTINQHYNSEQQLKTPTISGDLILGTGPILAQQVRRLAEYGTKHQWSVKKGFTGIYGWDFERKVIWKVGSGENGLQASPLTLTKGIEKWIYDLSDNIDTRTDRVTSFIDNPVNYEGIVTGYDRKFKEMYFTLHYTDTSGLTPVVYSKTLVYNEVLDAFTSEYPFLSSFYFNILNDIYSVSDQDEHLIYRHNIENAPTMQFYEVDHIFKLSFVQNGYGKQFAVPYNKLYLGIDIEMSHHDLARVRYETEYQTSLHDWANIATEYWIAPTYQEHKWKFPVNIQTSATDDAFSPGAPMRGTWMKTTLEYEGNDKIFIKSVNTNFIISQT